MRFWPEPMLIFSGTPLALDAQPDLNRQVYEIILELKTGETTTYGAIARRMGDVSLSQAVGYALGKNPFPIIVPLSPGARLQWQGRRLFGGGWHGDETEASQYRAGENVQRARSFFGGLPLQERPQSDW